MAFSSWNPGVQIRHRGRRVYARVRGEEGGPGGSFGPGGWEVPWASLWEAALWHALWCARSISALCLPDASAAEPALLLMPRVVRSTLTGPNPVSGHGDREDSGARL